MSFSLLIGFVILIILFNEYNKARQKEDGQVLVRIYLIALFFMGVAFIAAIFDVFLYFFIYLGMLTIGVAGIMKREFIDIGIGVIGLVVLLYHTYYLI